MTQLKNYISQPCLTDSIYAICRVILFNFQEYLPMGVIDLYFVGNVAKVPGSFLLSTSFYRVRDSAPDGSSPRGYSQNFLV
jgi:hypothetical protein